MMTNDERSEGPTAEAAEPREPRTLLEPRTVLEPRAPFEPPCGFEAEAGIGGRIGPMPEDFEVDEIPLYAPSGEGHHFYVRLRKRELTTDQLITAVARAAGTSPREVGAAGMKDKHAVTTQWLSLPATAKHVPEVWQLPEGVELLVVSRHDNKLRTGHLSGNRFRIRLVDVPGTTEEVAGKAARLSQALTERGLPNYFGAQRFGLGGNNIAQALRWLDLGGRGRDHRKQKLYASVLQSEVFNRYLKLRSDAGLERLLQGEVVRLDGSRAMFLVEDVEKEQARLVSGDVHLTGPMIGPKMRPSEGEALALERRAMEPLELDEGRLHKLSRMAPGARRDLIVRVEGLEVQVEGPARVVLTFALPAGSYATELIRVFTRRSFLEASRRRDD